MELAELIGLRPAPGAGLLVCLTRRCPMSCGHCSTSSGMAAGGEPDAASLRRFVRTLTRENRPDVMMLTGGEPLLLPDLVTELARTASAAGTRTAVLSGMFFARHGRVPGPVLRAAAAVDHFSASMDAHHEREIPRADVFHAVRRIRGTGTSVSFHLTGTGPGDPYLAEVTDALLEEFDGEVPALVNEIRPFGRAASWAARGRLPAADDGRALPCAMAAWPVVAFDGTVVACCNQDTVDRRPVPAHLRLGHIADEPWGVIRERLLGSPALRMIRTVGPLWVAAGQGPVPDEGTAGSYCARCRALGSPAEPAEGLARLAAGPAGALLDLTAARRQTAMGAQALVRRHGCAAYADLLTAPGHHRTDGEPETGSGR